MVHVEPTVFVAAEKDTVRGRRAQTLEGTILNAIAPWQPYEVPGTGEVLEQDYVGFVKGGLGAGTIQQGTLIANYDILSNADLLGAMGYGLGITPLVFGLSDGFTTDPSERKEIDYYPYDDVGASAAKRLGYLKVLKELGQATELLPQDEHHPSRAIYYKWDEDEEVFEPEGLVESFLGSKQDIYPGIQFPKNV